MDFKEAIMAFWPLIALQFILIIVAIVDLLRRKTFKHLSKSVWLLIIILVSLFGPILYFIIGRGDE